MKLKIGSVVAVKGTSITIKMLQESNKETLFFEGQKYNGVSIREYISIQRGFIDLVCMVEGEYLDEGKSSESGNNKYYIRKVEAKPIGYFKDNMFNEGIKYMPMIEDSAYLLPEKLVQSIFTQQDGEKFVIGKMLKEELPVALPWQKTFNSHLGIFGNTGSGKSNTLAKLYTTLFNEKADKIEGKSKFVLIDFNGEYTGDQLIDRSQKSTLILNTKEKHHVFGLRDEEFWNVETLSILFQATMNTQRPFLSRVINGRKQFLNNANSLTNYTKSIFKKIFSSAAPKPDCLDLARGIARIVGSTELEEKLGQVSWNASYDKFMEGRSDYYNADGVLYATNLEPLVNNIQVNVNGFDELLLRANIQLCSDVLRGFVQYEFIQPLLKRMEASVNGLKNVLEVVAEDTDNKVLKVISLRKCNSDIKKILPLLIAKHYYNAHRDVVDSPPNNTLHLIIDEAHNILSEQSARESESWKDYRLELFEEIIKEGRKFGMFITLASQRPADISPTIISQLHNYFIHKLVNDKDLQLIDNTISTLDKMSKNLIPTLDKGVCVITGTSFTIPMVVQIDILDREKQPDSADVDLSELWA